MPPNPTIHTSVRASSPDSTQDEDRAAIALAANAMSSACKYLEYPIMASAVDDFLSSVCEHIRALLAIVLKDGIFAIFSNIGTFFGKFRKWVRYAVNP